jgi:hypothetical protein
MNWKLLFTLSLMGLLMAIATISVIPSNIEWIFWLIIFCIAAYFIAKKAPGKYFLHGFVLSLLNCIWVTSAHVIFFSTYAANHAQEMQMSAGMPGGDHPRMMMLVMGPVIGIVSGLVQGLFAWIASLIFKKA